MSQRDTYLQAGASEFQRIQLLVEKYIVRRQDVSPDPSAQHYEEAAVKATRMCLADLLNVVRSQFCPAQLSMPAEVKVAILLKATADVLFGLEMNPFWRQHKGLLIGTLQMATNSAYDAIEVQPLGDPRVATAFAGTCADMAGIIINIHAGFEYLRKVSVPMKQDMMAIFGV